MGKNLSDRITEAVKGWQWVQNLESWAKNHSLPGFKGHSIYGILYFTLAEIKRDDIITRANAAAFSFFMALFPFLILLVSLLSLIRFDRYETFMENNIQPMVPYTAYVFLQDMIERLTAVPRSSAISLSFLVTIFIASNGMFQLMRGFDKSYEHTFKNRTMVKKRGIALLLIFFMGLLLITSVGFIVLGGDFLQMVSGTLEMPLIARVGVVLVRWIGTIALFYLLIATIYHLGPSLQKRLHIFSPGAAFAAFLSIITCLGLSYFVNNFGRFNELYGSLSAIVVLMIWIQINCLVLLIGYELNIAIAVSSNLERLAEEKNKEEEEENGE